MHLTAMEIFTTACSYISQTVEDSEDIIGFTGVAERAACRMPETENTAAHGRAELERPRGSGETMNREIPYTTR
ncbi:MAG: hypothetical protein ACLRRT_14560 [Ruthenibacterium lactatiformans]